MKLFIRKYNKLKLNESLLKQIGYTNKIPDYLLNYNTPKFIRYKLRYSLPKLRLYLKYLQRAVNNSDIYYIVPTRNKKYNSLYLLREYEIETLKKIVGDRYDATYLSMNQTHYIYKLLKDIK